MITDTIQEFFRNKPRFNIMLIKGDKVAAEDTAQRLDFVVIDIKKEILDGAINISDITGYTDLVIVLKKIASGHRGVIIKNIDILLSVLEKSKRREFFEKTLTTRFYADTILCIHVFHEEVPNYDDYNHGVVISGG